MADPAASAAHEAAARSDSPTKEELRRQLRDKEMVVARLQGELSSLKRELDVAKNKVRDLTLAL